MTLGEAFIHDLVERERRRTEILLRIFKPIHTDPRRPMTYHEMLRRKRRRRR